MEKKKREKGNEGRKKEGATKTENNNISDNDDKIRSQI